jgi:hypothetical protein
MHLASATGDDRTPRWLPLPPGCRRLRRSASDARKGRQPAISAPTRPARLLHRPGGPQLDGPRGRCPWVAGCSARRSSGTRIRRDACSDPPRPALEQAGSPRGGSSKQQRSDRTAHSCSRPNPLAPIRVAGRRLWRVTTGAGCCFQSDRANWRACANAWIQQRQIRRRRRTQRLRFRPNAEATRSLPPLGRFAIRGSGPRQSPASADERQRPTATRLPTRGSGASTCLARILLISKRGSSRSRSPRGDDAARGMERSRSSRRA